MRIKVDIVWQYGNQIGRAVDEFGYDEFNPSNQEDIDGCLFWYEEGNGACDCNRGPMAGLGDFPCGSTISFIEVKPIVPLH